MGHNFKKRRRLVQKQIKSQGAEAFLVTNIKNVGYLTGFTGSSAYLVLTPKSEILLSDSRYSSQLKEQCADLEVDIRDSTTTLLDSVERIAKSMKLNSLLYESNDLTKSAFDQLDSRLSNLNLVSSSSVVEKNRAIKDKTEIAAIRKSVQINQRAFEVIRAQMTADQTELQVAHNLEHQMRSFGASRCAFDPIVGVGPRAALPHGRPSEKRLGENPFVLIDWGAEVDLYLSDLTRVVITGKTSPKFEKIYNVVLKAQLAAIKKIRPGATLKSVDSAARKVIENAGYGQQFGHGLGHSFGLEIHEKPFLSPVSEGTLKAGMVITIEPGIYIPNFGGVRIEDDVLVTTDGHEVLSDLPKRFGECAVDL